MAPPANDSRFVLGREIARGGYRRADAPTHLAWLYGIRLAVPAMRETP